MPIPTIAIGFLDVAAKRPSVECLLDDQATGHSFLKILYRHDVVILPPNCICFDVSLTNKSF